MTPLNWKNARDQALASDASPRPTTLQSREAGVGGRKIQLVTLGADSPPDECEG
jgi:hypothetical protein